jgi:hypothetical protein
LPNAKSKNYDIVVFGSTPGGIGAAISAARRGLKTLLLEPSDHIGGLMTSGLGRTDIRSLEASGSIFREYASQIVQHYSTTYGADSVQVKQCNNGLWFEPSVAKKVLWNLLHQEPNVAILLSHELKSVEIQNNDLKSIIVQSLESEKDQLIITAEVFLDSTYEGDLAAMAGVPYVLGRESRDDWNEEYAGKLYMDFHPSKEVFPGSTGDGDDLIQSYNFRLCLTKNKDNQVEITKPSTYRRENYVSLLDDVKAERVNSIGDVMNMLPVPNEKTDCNNHHYCMCSTDLPEENLDYPDGDPQTRERTVMRHRHYIQGLLWFLQNDVGLPEPFREDARQWGYAADEFQESEHFPPQIYVREARRMQGEYTFTENDARLAPGLDRAPIHFDSIALGDYAIDSHATRKREPEGQDRALEGFLGLGWITEVYQIPYGIMVPQKVDRLLVPVAVSATHMGFGTIRMEPCWMQLGFAAGIAADLSIKLEKSVRDLPVDLLQDELLETGQRITYFEDVKWNDEVRIAAEYFGTKGFFTNNNGDLKEPLSIKEASQWISLARTLSGGRRLPVLPATDRILPAGTDMGPRLPKEEPAPRHYWESNPQLGFAMAKRWLGTAAKALDVKIDVNTDSCEGFISRGEFCVWIYELLKAKRAQLSKTEVSV